MKYLLDSSTCVQILRKGSAASAGVQLASKQPSEVSVCSIVVGELRFGAELSKDPAGNNQIIDRTFGQFASLPFDDVAAAEYARIRAALKALGTPIGANDLFIAAIAKSRGLILVTHNTGESAASMASFSKIG